MKKQSSQSIYESHLLVNEEQGVAEMSGDEELGGRPGSPTSPFINFSIFINFIIFNANINLGKVTVTMSGISMNIYLRLVISSYWHSHFLKEK